MGRPTKLTPETQKRIIDALAMGATRKDAVLSARVDYQSFLNWIEQGQAAGKGKYFEFFESVQAAEADVFRKMTAVILKAAAEGDWRASEAYLKRRDRANWGDNVDLTTDGKKIKPNTIEIVYVNDWRTANPADDDA